MRTYSKKHVSAFVLALLVTTIPVLPAADAPRSWPPDQFLPVTLERIASLPADEQPAWRSYWEKSRSVSDLMPPRSAPDYSPLKPLTGPPIGGQHSRGLKLKAAPSWYASKEAEVIADRIVEAQTKCGGWTKGVNYTQPIKKTDKVEVWTDGTFDNDATAWEMRELALTIHATKDLGRAAPWRDAFLRGLEYIFEAQYPNGGFPQIYPLVGGYHDAITFNDDAMVQAIELLRDIAAGKSEFSFVPETLRQRCGPAVLRGIGCILKTQIRTEGGQLIGWCQQYDALTLKPCAARNFEPIAACSNESASLVRFLMTLSQPKPDVVTAVQQAVAWFERTSLKGKAWVSIEGRRELVDRSGALLWARYYEIGTDKPIFGDRDRTIHYTVDEISSERRAGYAWFGEWPMYAIGEYGSWSKAIKR